MLQNPKANKHRPERSHFWSLSLSESHIFTSFIKDDASKMEFACNCVHPCEVLINLHPLVVNFILNSHPLFRVYHCQEKGEFLRGFKSTG